MGFKRDFKLGKNGETAVKQLFKKFGIDLEENVNKAKLKEYDLIGKLGTKKITIECKYDYMSEETGNLAIEYENCANETDSGINATKAKLWIHLISDKGFPTIWATSVKKLKEFIKNTKPWKTVTRAGDGNASLYLYNDFTILDAVFTRVDNVDKDTFVKIIKELLK